jgi:hypothetical protein
MSRRTVTKFLALVREIGTDPAMANQPAAHAPAMIVAAAILAAAEYVGEEVNAATDPDRGK